VINYCYVCVSVCFLFHNFCHFQLKTSCFISDIDECSSGQDVCRRGMCQNVEGSYLCQCKDGWRLSRSGDECVGKSLRLFSYGTFTTKPFSNKFHSMFSNMFSNNYLFIYFLILFIYSFIYLFVILQILTSAGRYRVCAGRAAVRTRREVSDVIVLLASS
jgi:hypothetical protein